MALSVFPAGAVETKPTGATSAIFQGVSSVSSYIYPSTLSAGTYIFTYSGEGITYINTNSNSTLTGTTGTGEKYIKLNSSEAAFAPYSTWTTKSNLESQTSITSTSFFISDGTTFYARGGSSAPMYTSTDGITWTQVSTPTISLGKPVYNSSGLISNKWLATNESSNVATSTNGLTWTQRNTNTSAAAIGGVAINPNATNKYAALGYNGSGVTVVGTSTDGVTWTNRTASVSGAQYGYGMATNGTASTNQIYVGVRGSNHMTSTDGVTWATRTSAIGRGYQAAWGAGVYCSMSTVGGSTNRNKAETSTDGVTWTLRTVDRQSNPEGIVFLNNLFYIYGNSEINTSTDGVTWSKPRKISSASSPSINNIAATSSLTLAYDTSTRFVLSAGAAYYALYNTSIGSLD
jgi:hypothetical protein